MNFFDRLTFCDFVLKYFTENEYKFHNKVFNDRIPEKPFYSHKKVYETKYPDFKHEE